MSFLLSTVFILLFQSSFAAENPTHEGKDGLNHEFTVAQFSRFRLLLTVAQFSRLSREDIESCVISDFLIKAIVSVLMETGLKVYI